MYTVHEQSRRHLTLTEKQDLIAEIERRVRADGRGVKPVARQLGIAPGSYYRWLRQGVRPTPVAVTPAPVVTAMGLQAPARALGPGAIDSNERVRIMVAVRAGLANGVPIKVTARKYGITPGVFYRWAREAGRDSVGPAARENVRVQALVVSPPRVPAFRSVTLSVPEPPRALSLVAPSGHRIEGLSVETAAALLRALS